MAALLASYRSLAHRSPEPRGMAVGGRFVGFGCVGFALVGLVLLAGLPGLDSPASGAFQSARDWFRPCSAAANSLEGSSGPGLLRVLGGVGWFVGWLSVGLRPSPLLPPGRWLVFL